MKLLAIDVGNTSIHGAWRSGGVWRKHFRLSSSLSKYALARSMARLLKSNMDADVMIASVVPETGARLKKFISTRVAGRCFLIGKDCPVPVVNRYRRPREVGVDRLLSALAAYRRYQRPIIVIDFGTAITFDVINGRGEYLGGVIAPGIEISLDALFQRTALLPRIQLRHPQGILGRDTIQSIRVGCSVGIGGLCDRITESIASFMKTQPRVIATGGYAKFMKRYTRVFTTIHENLILDGIFYTYQSLPKKKIK